MTSRPWGRRLQDVTSGYVIDEFTRVYQRIEALEALADRLRASPLALQLGLEDDAKTVSRSGCADAANRKTAEAAPSGSAPLDSAQPAPGNLTIRLRLDRDQWTARSVEYDIAGQGDTIVQALQSWALCFDLHLKQGLENVPPMPGPSAASGRRCAECGGSGSSKVFRGYSCPVCHGTGDATEPESKCPDCGDIGYFTVGEHEYMCKACKKAAPETKCPGCQGTGQRGFGIAGIGPCEKCRGTGAAAAPEKADCEFGNGCVHADDLFKIIEMLDGKQIMLPTTEVGARAIARVRQRLAGSAAEPYTYLCAACGTWGPENVPCATCAEKAAAEPIDPRPMCIQCGKRWVPPEGVDATVTPCIPCRDKDATLVGLGHVGPLQGKCGDCGQPWPKHDDPASAWDCPGKTAPEAKGQPYTCPSCGSFDAERAQLRVDLARAEERKQELAERCGQYARERDAARAESASQRVRAVKAEEALQTSRELCDVLRESERELRARVDELEAADKAWIDSSKYVADMKRRTDDAESALQTSRALCDELRESATAWRGKCYAAAARVEQLEPLIVGERIAKEKFALADEVVRQVRRWAKYCTDNKFQMYGDLPMLHAIEKYEAYDAALKAVGEDGGTERAE